MTIFGYTVLFTNMTLFTLVLLMAAAAIVLCPTLPVNNLVARYIGKVSYSVYLLHMIVLGQVAAAFHASSVSPGNLSALAFAVAVLAASVVASTVTFYLIEEPGKAVGRWLTAKRKPDTAASPAFLERSVKHTARQGAVEVLPVSTEHRR